jgi:mRNA interferase RelE/StbE
VYRLLVGNQATKDLDRLQGGMLERIGEAILRLRNNPRPPGYIKLKDDAAFRIRVGDYRIVYDIDDGQQTVQILRVKHRRDVYRDL